MQDPELEKRIELAGLKGNAGVRALAEASLISRNPAWRERLSKLLDPRLALAEEAHPFAPSPGPADLAPGDINIGTAIYADGSDGPAVDLGLDQLTRHVLASGVAGGGKSFFLTYTAAQLIARKVPVWIIDTESEYFARLAPLFSPDELLYFDLNTFKRNPFEPLAGEGVLEMVSRCRDVFAEALWFGEGGKNLLSESLMSLLRERGVLSGGESYPTVAEVLDKVGKTKPRFTQRLAEYRASVVNRLTSVVDLVQCYDCAKAGDFRVDKLIESGKSIVFDVRGGIDIQNLFVKDLLKAASVVLERSR